MVKHLTLFLHGITMVSIEHRETVSKMGMEVEIIMKKSDGTDGEITLFLDGNAKLNWPNHIQVASGPKVQIQKLIFHAKKILKKRT